jgi:hypothetical protein
VGAKRERTLDAGVGPDLTGTGNDGRPKREREREGDGKLPEIWRARRKMQKKK